MYEADPFEAKRQVEARQAKHAVKSASAEESGKPSRSSDLPKSEFSDQPEVKMSLPLRDLVENAIKTVRPLSKTNC